jgi:hypothetical protein
MPFKKLADPHWRPRQCRHPSHKPPSNIVLPSGTHQYTCPGCGEVTATFDVEKPSLSLHPELCGEGKSPTTAVSGLAAYLPPDE